jgi:hypothetical protein
VKVSVNWIVPAGQVWLVRQGEIVAKRKLRERLDSFEFDELIVNCGNDRDAVSVRSAP